MKVERKDLFDFSVTLSEVEFNAVKDSTDESDKSIEQQLEWIIRIGLDETTNP